jgi:hypothetical protein
MRAGEIRCLDCDARYELRIGWSGWIAVRKRTKAECGSMGGRPRKEARK